MSAAEAARLILRVACSEFGPERLTSEYGDRSDDAVSALRGCRTDYDFCECFQDWSELKKFWCPITNCYDICSIENESSFEWKEDDLGEMKSFLQKVNALLSKLKASCNYLENLELNATAPPDLYDYLIGEEVLKRHGLTALLKIDTLLAARLIFMIRNHSHTIPGGMGMA
jgi:hypothetical protein